MKKIIATLGLIGVLLASSTAAKTGLLVSDFQGSDNQPTCSEERTNSKSNINWGIIVISGFTGTISAGFTGIFVAAGFSKNDDNTKTPADCGI